ncbi:uncharacterized protein [Gossypium hirsutum]|uniref:RNase H type-1 domain-containing protein n=1 Tax=Gossypium hirsutum TaxID=3635 RepID=A0A1U8JQ51_GOSHI|nr:uncharacterized protein LOC107908094 [Gossypium hirsutum]
MENLGINAISEEGMVEETLSGIRPYEPESVLNNWTAKEISTLTEKCDLIFRLLSKHNLGVWDEGCQEAFDKNAMKGSVIADFITSRALEDYKPLNFDFPNEDLMCVETIEEDSQKDHIWKLNFDVALNAVGIRIGAVLVSSNGDHYPFTRKLDFDYTKNMAEYEACIMGIRAAVERKIKVLEVYEDSALVIYQLKGEWETRDPILICYRELVLELIKEFDDITFCYRPRHKNQMANALATLASMIKVNK